MRIILILIGALLAVSNIVNAKTSAFNSGTPSEQRNNQVLVSLPNIYDAKDIVKVEVNDQSYLVVHYQSKDASSVDFVLCAQYTDSGLVKTHLASRPVVKPLCDAGIAAFEKATN